MKPVYFLSVLLMPGLMPVAFAEAEELVYLDMGRNNEITKQEVSDAFWNNPLDTPPMLFLLGLVVVPIIIAWKRKWHIHDKTSDMRRDHN